MPRALLTRAVIETALNEEMTGHLGYERHDPAGQGTSSGNVRNGSRPKTVLTDSTGPVEIDVPRDRAGTFEPQIVNRLIWAEVNTIRDTPYGLPP